MITEETSYQEAEVTSNSASGVCICDCTCNCGCWCCCWGGGTVSAGTSNAHTIAAALGTVVSDAKAVASYLIS